MPVREHLRELRLRVILGAAGLIVGAIAGWFFFTPVFEALQQPVLELAESEGSDVSINFAGLVTALDVRIKVAMLIGMVLSSPWWLYQVWAFIAPGLKRSEKRYTLVFMSAAVPLFVGGVWLAWVIFPHAVQILTSFTPALTSSFLDAQLYMSFVMRLLVAFGLAFVFPVIMVALTWGQVVRAATWLKGWRWAIVVMFTFAAIMTPMPDATSMILMALPMCGLYFGAVGICLLRERTVRRRESRAAHA